MKKNMTNIESYDLGWMVTDTIHAAHFYRTNRRSKVAVSHCGVMSSKSDLEEPARADHCGSCQAVEDMRQDEQSVLAPA